MTKTLWRLRQRKNYMTANLSPSLSPSLPHINHGNMTKEQVKDRPYKKGFNVGPANLPDGTYKRKSMAFPPRPSSKVNPTIS